MNTKDFQRLLVELTQDAGMAQTEIAAELKISQAEVSRIMAGQRRRVTFDTGQRLIELHRRKRRAIASAQAEVPASPRVQPRPIA